MLNGKFYFIFILWFGWRFGSIDFIRGF